MDSEERIEEAAKECVHKTKLVQFLGRTTPIILQNENGPCPLLAICNVLLLRNNLNLNPDITEVSQEKLLSLVAERLIDSNSNVNNKDTGYVENQQQNIADAIDLLPLLATGIDVNIKFRRIDDFEFTRECAIFDLLDIPLYHGWIVDPQDHDTAEAVGSMSYNALMGKLVALETQNVKEESKSKPEEDAIDFAAATTATLGVPSPCLSRGRSFDESPRSDSNDKKFRKGDVEEEAELLRVLQLSEAELPTSVDDSPIADTFEDNALDCIDGNACRKKFVPLDTVDTVEGMTGNEIETGQQQPILVCTDGIACHEKFVPLDSIGTIEGMTGNEIETCLQQPISCPLDDHSDSGNGVNDPKSHETTLNTPICSSSLTSDRNPVDQLTKESAEVPLCNHVVEGEKINTFQNGEVHSMLPGGDMECVTESHKDTVGGEEHVGTQSLSTVDTSELSNSQGAFVKTGWSSFCGPDAGSDSSSVSGLHVEVPEAISPSVNGSEPIYEGEECMLDSGAAICEDREPVYEGESVLAEQVDKSSIDATSLSLKDEITPREGELIRNFLRSSASQLTIYGLFCLQDGLKERELCVFFRNNHFNTMFKIDGELYILATDQGYISQPDLVWEKLNEVNGDTIFMTGNFKEFKVEGNADGKWDEHNAMTSTSDYLASIDHSAQEVNSNFNSDLQLAIALQQQEFEQQKQPQRPVQQPSTTGSSRLVTGPQVSKSSGRSSSSSTPTKHDTKSKEKCIVM